MKATGIASIGVTGLAGCVGGDGGDGGDGSDGGSDGGSGGGDGGDGGSDGGSSDNNEDGGSTDGDTGGLSQESITVLTTYYPGVSYSGVVRAQYQDYFEKVGFSDVTLDYSLDLNPLQVVTSDDYDFVIASHLDTIAGRAQGVPVQSITTTQGNTVQAYAYDEDRHDINGVQDFPGLTLGLQNDPDVTTFNGEILSNELSESQREEINETFVGYDVRNLLTGQVDLLTKFPTNADGIALELQGEASFGYVDMKDYLEVPGNAGVTTTSMIEDQPDVTQAFTRAHVKGLADSLDPNQEESVAQDCLDSLEDAGVAGDIYPEGVDPLEVNRVSVEMFREYRPIDEWETNGVAWNPVDRVATAQRLFAEAGQLDDTSDPETIVNNSFVNEVTDDQGNLIWEE